MGARDWSTLPLDLLGDIAMRLETIEDFIYFSAVCDSWNRVSSLMKHQWRPIIPWLLLGENTSNNPYCVRKIFNPSNNKCYSLNLPETLGAKCWGSDYGWIAMVDRSLNVSLFNPITKAEICFPSAEILPGRYPYNQETYGNEENYINLFLGCFMKKLIVLKVSQEFVIVAIYDNSEHIAFAKQGDKSWTSVFFKEVFGIRMFDVVAVDDYVFALYNDASLVYWNIKDFQGHELVKPMTYSLSEFNMFSEFISGLGTLYLVQSGYDLLMVLRFKKGVLDSDGDDYAPDVYETTGFSVYRLDRKDKKWEEIKDHATLFVGRNSTMSVSAKSLQANRIYFTDDELELCTLVTEHGGHDMGVYDIKSKNKWRFYEGDDIRSESCTPTWFIPRL